MPIRVFVYNSYDGLDGFFVEGKFYENDEFLRKIMNPHSETYDYVLMYEQSYYRELNIPEKEEREFFRNFWKGDMNCFNKLWDMLKKEKGE